MYFVQRHLHANFKCVILDVAQLREGKSNHQAKQRNKRKKNSSLHILNLYTPFLTISGFCIETLLDRWLTVCLPNVASAIVCRGLAYKTHG